MRHDYVSQYEVAGAFAIALRIERSIAGAVVRLNLKCTFIMWAAFSSRFSRSNMVYFRKRVANMKLVELPSLTACFDLLLTMAAF